MPRASSARSGPTTAVITPGRSLDQGWHFTGAAEPAGDKLDQAWFAARPPPPGATRRHAIYAVSYRRTPLTFPLAWNPSIDYVYAVDVTDRYRGGGPKQPPGTVPVQ